MIPQGGQSNPWCWIWVTASSGPGASGLLVSLERTCGVLQGEGCSVWWGTRGADAHTGEVQISHRRPGALHTVYYHLIGALECSNESMMTNLLPAKAPGWIAPAWRGSCRATRCTEWHAGVPLPGEGAIIATICRKWQIKDQVSVTIPLMHDINKDLLQMQFCNMSNAPDCKQILH